MADQDYQVVKLAVMGEVKSHFRPEFINRIDEIVVFHALDEKNIAAIAKVQLKGLEKRVESMEMRIQVSDAAVAELAKAGFDPVYGARPLKRAIQQQIENPLSKAILEGKFGPKDTILVDSKNGVFTFEKSKAKEKIAA
jgi:ATP-dependent Clp protease ATP-binding subunit ClpB